MGFYIRPEGLDGGAPFFDSLAKLYLAIVIIWTSFLITGVVYLILNRNAQCVRIRNLPLAISAVACLHAYWVLIMNVYAMNGIFPCTAEYWAMSIYLPFGIALFQANSMQLLSIAGLQRKMLQVQDSKTPLVKPTSNTLHRYWIHWNQMSPVKRAELGIAVGMVVQCIVSLSIFLASRKFHDFGIMAEPVSPAECRHGTEWIPSILWQLSWAWFCAPYILWKIRNIKDVHHWRLQTILCVIAALPGSPLWLTALYSSSDAWASINKHWPPPLWFTPGILTMQAVTIFFPCYELIASSKRQRYVTHVIQDWEQRRAVGEDKSLSNSSGVASTTQTTSTRTSNRGERYSRRSFEKALERDAGALLHFAVAKEFTGENITFLNYVRDWKAAWQRVRESEAGYDWEVDPSGYRAYFFRIAVGIYADCVHLKSAEFPINIESHIYAALEKRFGDAARCLDRPVSDNIATPFSYSRDDEGSLGSSSMIHLNARKMPTPITLERLDSQTMFQTDDCFFKKNIMHIDTRLPSEVTIPADFGLDDFDKAEESVKYMVFTNTWPKFVDMTKEASIILGDAERGFVSRWSLWKMK